MNYIDIKSNKAHTSIDTKESQLRLKKKKKEQRARQWWCTPLTPVLWRQRQLQDSWVYTEVSDAGAPC